MTVLFIIIAIALIFEFINGFHDVANVVATPIASKSLSPYQAITPASLSQDVASCPCAAMWQQLFGLGDIVAVIPSLRFADPATRAQAPSHREREYGLAGRVHYWWGRRPFVEPRGIGLIKNHLWCGDMTQSIVAATRDSHLLIVVQFDNNSPRGESGSKCAALLPFITIITGLRTVTFFAHLASDSSIALTCNRF